MNTAEPVTFEQPVRNMCYTSSLTVFKFVFLYFMQAGFHLQPYIFLHCYSLLTAESRVTAIKSLFQQRRGGWFLLFTSVAIVIHGTKAPLMADCCSCSNSESADSALNQLTPILKLETQNFLASFLTRRLFNLLQSGPSNLLFNFFFFAQS